MGDKCKRVGGAVWMLMREQDGAEQIVLQKRRRTGYADGLWDVSVSGNVEAGEPRKAELIREAAEELGLIDDEDYARRLAQSLFGGKHFGARRVKQELRRKGIADDVIEAVLAEFSTDRDETEENIRAILERKYPGA